MYNFIFTINNYFISVIQNSKFKWKSSLEYIHRLLSKENTEECIISLLFSCTCVYREVKNTQRSQRVRYFRVLIEINKGERLFLHRNSVASCTCMIRVIGKYFADKVEQKRVMSSILYGRGRAYQYYVVAFKRWTITQRNRQVHMRKHSLQVNLKCMYVCMRANTYFAYCI